MMGTRNKADIPTRKAYQQDHQSEMASTVYKTVMT